MTVSVVSPGRATNGGDLLRLWRTRRRLSQLELASTAGVSTRHLSFVETGRSRPSREFVLHLAEVLAVPLRERNAMLLGAGFAPAFPDTPLIAPELGEVLGAVQGLLRGHDPYPALVMNRHFELVDANESMAMLTEWIDPALLEPPINIMRVTLHPDGLARHIVNLGEYREHLLGTVARELMATGDEFLSRLHDEIGAYPYGTGGDSTPGGTGVLPLRLRHEDGELTFFSIYSTFGSPRDIAVAELLIESIFPADERTRAFLHRRAPRPAE